jgi:hypothetical protein
MSAWRKEASKRLPELQRIIASRVVNNPMRLWIELQSEFNRLCQQEPIPLDLLRRFWAYALWCMEREGDVGTGAALGFCEHLMDTKESRSILPEIMSRQEYQSLKSLLLYHNAEADYEAVLKCFGT